MTKEQRVALITGGSRGIGKAIVLQLARDRVKVAVNYKANQQAADSVVEEVMGMGGEAVAVQGDVGNRSDVEKMMKKAVDSLGSIDILVNNAGIIHDSLLMRMSEEVWDNVINTNLKGAYYCTKAVLSSMVRQRWGRIINVVSVVGIEGNPGQSNYAASKAGLIAFSRSIAKEVAARGITVNAVAPGYISTEIVDDLAPKFKDLVLSRIPQDRFGSVEDVSNLVGFLAGDKAGYITGEVIRIDGGIEL